VLTDDEHAALQERICYINTDLTPPTRWATTTLLDGLEEKTAPEDKRTSLIIIRQTTNASPVPPTSEEKERAYLPR